MTEKDLIRLRRYLRANRDPNNRIHISIVDDMIEVVETLRATVEVIENFDSSGNFWIPLDKAKSILDRFDSKQGEIDVVNIDARED